MDGGTLITVCALFGLMFGFGMFTGLRSKTAPINKLDQFLKDAEQNAAEMRAHVAEIEAISEGEQSRIRGMSARIREIGEKIRLPLSPDAPGLPNLEGAIDSIILDLDRWADEYRESVEGSKIQRDNHKYEILRGSILERQISNANWEWRIFIFGSIVTSTIALMRIILSSPTGDAAPWDATVFTAAGVAFGVFARGARKSYAAAMAMANDAIRRDDLYLATRILRTIEDRETKDRTKAEIVLAIVSPSSAKKTAS